jgi:hypothetical protein
MSTTITAEPWEIFSTHFLTKKSNKCKKKNTKIRKDNITSKNDKSKKPSKFKDYFPKILYCPL